MKFIINLKIKLTKKKTRKQTLELTCWETNEEYWSIRHLDLLIKLSIVLFDHKPGVPSA